MLEDGSWRNVIKGAHTNRYTGFTMANITVDENEPFLDEDGNVVLDGDGDPAIMPFEIIHKGSIIRMLKYCGKFYICIHDARVAANYQCHDNTDKWGVSVLINNVRYVWVRWLLPPFNTHIYKRANTEYKNIIKRAINGISKDDPKDEAGLKGRFKKRKYAGDDKLDPEELLQEILFLMRLRELGRITIAQRKELKKKLRQHSRVCPPMDKEDENKWYTAKVFAVKKGIYQELENLYVDGEEFKSIIWKSLGILLTGKCRKQGITPRKQKVGDYEKEKYKDVHGGYQQDDRNMYPKHILDDFFVRNFKSLVTPKDNKSDTCT